MFRMTFQPAVDYSTPGGEQDERTVRKVSCGPAPEGKVGKIRSFDHPTSLRSMAMRNSELADIDLVNLEGSPAHDSTLLHAASFRVNDNTTDKTTIAAYLHYQDATKGHVSMDAPGALVEARNSTSTATHRNEQEDSEAMTEMLNKLMQERKSVWQKNDDTQLGTPLQEPLLAAHDQEDLDLMAKEEAKVKAERLAEDERLEHERQSRELRALALCTTVIEPSVTRTKPKGMLGRIGVGGVFRFMKSPIRIFRSTKKYEDPDARAAEWIVPRASLFGGCQTLHSSGTSDSQLAMMRNAAQPRMTSQPLIIQFATVESTQRDVPAWTREEYLRRNGRVPQNSTHKEEDEELGGIEGNNLMNQYYVDGVVTDYDSDSD